MDISEDGPHLLKITPASRLLFISESAGESETLDG